jgi:sugar lactone lactonase YvrE
MRMSRIDTTRCIVGEGALWDPLDQALYFIDVIGKRVHRHDPASGETRSWATPDIVGALALRERGGAVVAVRDGLHALDFETGAVEPIARHGADPARVIFNDGKVDRRGRFVVGLSDLDFDAAAPQGGLYSLGAGHRLSRLAGDISLSNGPCWSPDDKTLYFSDTHRKTTYTFDYDIETGAVAGRRALIDTTSLGGEPDGATVDADGLIWMGVYRGGKIAAFRPDGRLERVVDMPVRMAVSLSFGGPKLDQLYVTTIDPTFFREPADAAAGHVYVIEDLGVRGLPEPRFAG